MRWVQILAVGCLLAVPRVALAAPDAGPALKRLVVSPTTIVLEGKGASQRLTVTARTTTGDEIDLAGKAKFRSTNPRVASVDEQGVVRLRGNGSTVIVVRAGGRAVPVPVQARHAERDPGVNFVNDILPLMSRKGCNNAACHAKAGGQNGFQLSVLAFDTAADYRAITRLANSRRINRLEPARSLLLLKPTLSLPHGGGQRFEVGSPDYNLFAGWIAAGAPYDGESKVRLTRVEIAPTERVLAPESTQRIAATAHYSDGSRRDVTHLAQYESNETAIAEVDEDGVIHTQKFTGEAAVMVRYMGQVNVVRITVPLPERVARTAYDKLPRHNFVDDHVYAKLSQLNLLPSGQCDDATFLRRVSLDLIGTLPTREETSAFLAAAKRDSQPARRDLVDALLERPEYADYWGMRWVNLLLVDRDPLFPKGAFAYDQWVRESFRQNKPFDQFAREIITAAGETYRDGPANFYRALASPTERGRSISQLFIGVRIDCAQCHHHPFERWGQDDFYGMTAYFARVKQKGSKEFERVVYVATSGEVRHPKTGEVVQPKALGGPTFDGAFADPRQHLADWLTKDDNPYFAPTAVNRIWGLLMGRSFVEPVDDFRVTNPASNEPLLDALAQDFIAHGYDVKRLLRTITASAAYQRSSQATTNNARDTRNYSRYYTKRLPAEVLLDAVSQVTGVPEVYRGHPYGSRAIQLWDNKLPIEFLDVFGKPSRLSVCECDRPTEGSVTQMLHLMNSIGVHTRLTSEVGAVAAMEKSGKPPRALVEELYLTTYNRPPRPKELAAAEAHFARPDTTRRQALEDLLWALMNSAEFLFNH